MEKYKLHITYGKELTLKELVEVLDECNKAINDVNRKYGVNNKTVCQYAPIVKGVEKGSILIELLIKFAVDVACGLLVEFISHRLYKLRDNNKGKSNTIIDVKYEEKCDSKIIDIHIEKHN